MSDEQSRPQPRYGELAPEGWSWKPESAAGDDAAAGTAPAGDTPAEPSLGGTADAPPANLGATSASGSGQRPASGAAAPDTSAHGASGVASGEDGRMPGVPHNLGVGAAVPPHTSATPQAPQSRPGEQFPSYRPDAPPQGFPQSPAPVGRGDRIATIILLAVGTLGVLYLSMTMMLMPSSFRMIAAIVELDGFTVPSSVQTLGTTGALILLALYALMLIFSIQRLRARKLAFWVPLSAGVLSVIIVIAITTIAITQMPELLTVISDPDIAARLLDTGALLNQ